LFAAGFLAGLSQNKDLEVCGKMGCVAAAEVISSMGARPKNNLQDLFDINKL
jgi:sugar/nucleoside kinase (ribokinase family)